MDDPHATLLPTLVHIQATLDGDLSLRALAGHAGRSVSHFHELFTKCLGETPKAYATRLRMERAAVLLWLHETTVLQAALEVGYQHHETFTRAFRRHFGMLPKEVKRSGIGPLTSRAPGRRPGHGATEPAAYSLSATRIVTLKRLDLAFKRHVGPYEAVPDSIFREVQDWAAATLPSGYRPLLGIGHDTPGLTAPDKLRFDAAVAVEGRFSPDDQIAHEVIEGGLFAVTTHVGHFSTLTRAYGELFGRLSAMRSCQPAGPPAIEMYHEAYVDADLMFNHTDIYLPVVRRSRLPRGPRSEARK